MKKLKLLTCALLFLGIGTTKSQTLTTLWGFSASTSNPYPTGSVILLGNTLYGMTPGGGVNNVGMLFSYNVSTNTQDDLYDFTANIPTGDYPYGSLTPSATGAVLYGMTSTENGPTTYGCIFSYTISTNTYALLSTFSGTSGSYPGANPQGSLTLSGSTLYGMTESGGASNGGVIFSISTSGTGYTEIHSFTGSTTDGSFPYGSFLLVGTRLYGMTSQGGTSGKGTIFYINTTSPYGFHVAFSFNGTTGSTPLGSLIAGPGGILYGMTSAGGANSKGVIFSFNTDGASYSDVHDFGGTDGNDPHADLSYSGGGTVLYGMTAKGGTHSDGNIFSFNTSGSTCTDVIDFNGIGDNGYQPFGNLTLSNDVMYGMTTLGGLPAGGNLFSVTDICDFAATTSATNASCDNSSNGSATATTIYGISPYTYSWSTGGISSTITGLAPGTYTVIVTDNAGCGVTTTVTVASTMKVDNVSVSCGDNGTGGITVAGTGGVAPYTYLWEPGSETNPTETFPNGTTYTCTVTDANGCTATSTVDFACPGSAFNNKQAEITTQMTNMTIYPNPSKGAFNVSGLTSGMRVETYDYTGRLISTTTATAENMRLNMANQADGIYLIRILSTDGTLIKQTKMMKVQ